MAQATTEPDAEQGSDRPLILEFSNISRNDLSREEVDELLNRVQAAAEGLRITTDVKVRE